MLGNQLLYSLKIQKSLRKDLAGSKARLSDVHGKLRPQKSLGSHTLPHLIFTTTKKSHAPHQMLSLGKHVKHMHFSNDMVFSLALIFFPFFLMRTKKLIFQFQKKQIKKKITRPHHFSIFF